MTKQISLKLPTCPSSISRLEPFVNELTAQYSVSKELFPNILISLTEAVNNAIEHGNCNDESKSVNIHTHINGKGLSVRVIDQGCGFNHLNIPDPTKPENIETCGGRGVFLIKQLCDEVKFKNNGSTVEMYFNIK